MIDPARDRPDLRAPILLSILFVALNAILLVAVAPADVHLRGGDLDTYRDPAIAFFRHGDFVELDDPTKPSTYRLPFYTLMAALPLYLTNGESFKVIVPMQLALWLAIGWMTWDVARAWLARGAGLAMALVLFNPTVLGVAYILQSQNLFAFFLATAGWLLLRRREAPTMRAALGVGIALGAASLSRPGGQFLIPLLPFALPLFAWLSGEREGFLRHAGRGLVASIVGALVIAPWMVYSAANGQGFRIGSPTYLNGFLIDNISFLEANRDGIAYGVAKSRLSSIQEEWLAANRPDLARADREAQSEAANGFLLGRLVGSYSPKHILGALAPAWANLFVGGGAGNLRNVLGMEGPDNFKLVRETAGANYVTAFFGGLREAGWASALVGVGSVAFAVICRILGAIGLMVMILRGAWTPLIVVSGLSLYYAALHLFVGASHYRASIEMYLALLTVFGVDALRRAISRPGRP
ncbi:MAG: hypothetical protein FJX47_02440 [Alphaproteobacteria bacterium]|nr:hypothetical protein [Alphaproteobacteria bacterium]